MTLWGGHRLTGEAADLGRGTYRLAGGAGGLVWYRLTDRPVTVAGTAWRAGRCPWAGYRLAGEPVNLGQVPRLTGGVGGLGRISPGRRARCPRPDTAWRAGRWPGSGTV